VVPGSKIFFTFAGEKESKKKKTSSESASSATKPANELLWNQPVDHWTYTVLSSVAD
jgi:hypothetical protein